ncbi:GNAT family N-acetyltransferase [Candidatus Bathyarchaeota archaeon]|nr:GNAT family N-acetyltransferase [Candidatus Bathyarchaeota archaeon]
MLEGKNVNLRIMEKEDLPVLREWDNNPEFMGRFEPLRQETRTDLERTCDNLKDAQRFFVEKKDGAKIGYIAHFLAAGEIELGYFIVPTERRKGYASEAIKILADYLFLSKHIVRIQAKADLENLASWKALEKAGFTREGILRKTYYCWGEHRDDCIYSILREEWKEPKVLA